MQNTDSQNTQNIADTNGTDRRAHKADDQKPAKGNRKKKGKSSKLTTWVLVILLLAGLGIMAYPSVSNYINSRHSTQAALGYSEAVDSTDYETLSRLRQEAMDYNHELHLQQQGRPSKIDEYTLEEMMLLEGSQVIGTLSIPSIDVTLPIYHGTDSSVLVNGIGHFEQSSLPVGGSSTHAVLTGHRGLPSAMLLTRLDELKEGDVFLIRALGEVMTYEVDQIRVVEPEDVHDLVIEDGKDYVTLVTCTPYGVNTHRLLVRGVRTDNRLDPNVGFGEANMVSKEQVMIGLAILFVGGALVYLIFFARRADEGESSLQDDDLPED